MASPYYNPSPAQQGAVDAMAETAGKLQAKEIEKRYKLGKDEIASRYKIAAMQSGDTKAQIEATREYQRGQLAQAAAEMERVNIPRVEIERFVAEHNYDIASQEMALKRQAFEEDKAQFQKTYGLQEAAVTGMFGGQQTLAMQQFLDGQADRARQFGLSEAEITGQYQGAPTLAMQQFQASEANLARQFGLSEAGVTGMYNGQQTLAGQQFSAEQAERQRRYALDVAKFGSDLASQPDRYFQARRFAAMDAPRLLGGAGAAQAGAYAPGGGATPTPGIATMGAYLSGQDPYGQQQATYGGPSGGGYMAQEGGGGAYGDGGGAYGGDPAAHKQIAAIAKASPPSPFDGLDESDTATLKLMESIYKRGGQAIQGGSMESMSDASKGFLSSAGSALGYDPQELKHTYDMYRPAQGNANLA